LLTFTEQFDNPAWALSNLLAFGSGSTANATAAPNGTTTADLVTENIATNAHSIFGTGFSVTSGVSYAISVDVKDNGRRYVSIRGQNAISPANYPWATFDLTNVASVRNAAASNSLIESVGSGWYRCTLVWTADSTVTGGNAVIALSNVSTAPAISNTLGNSYTGNGTSGIYLWGAQLETGSTATAYQRVVSQYDVTEAGVSSLSYLAFDGVDDFLVTPTIAPGIDKAQVFAGVRKLTSHTGIIAELSTDTTSNTGAFAAYVSASSDVLVSRGSSGTQFAVATGGTVPPISYVLSALSSISGPFARVRVNAVQTAENTGTQGTGNFLAYPMYIGIRGSGSSLPLNGQIFSLIVRFGANLTADQINSTEAWVGGKVGFNWANLISPTIFARDETAVLDRFNQTIERRAV
jgi:hypothetical protein